MKIGFIVSMYDEIDVLNETITNLRKYDCKIIVIQSDPGNEEMILDESICDKYEKMPDVAGNREEYAKIIEEKKEGKGEMIGPIALTRNFSRGFTLIQDFDVDYVITITGDTKITNPEGITKIIKKMEKNKISYHIKPFVYEIHKKYLSSKSPIKWGDIKDYVYNLECERIYFSLNHSNY